MGSKKPAPAPQPVLSGQLAQVNRENIAGLRSQAAGTGPSVSAQALQASKQRNLSQQLAAAQTAPSRNINAIQRQLVSERGAAERAVAQGSKIGRLQEQQAAQSGIMTMATGKLNRDAQMAQLEAQRQAQAAAGKNQLTGQVLGAVGTVVGGIYGGGPAGAAVGGAAGTALGESLSDERAKQNIKSADKELKSFLDELASRHNKSSAVSKSIAPNGKLDMDRGFSAVLASQAELNKRINKLEKKKS
jgi:hypothetical protein